MNRYIGKLVSKGVQFELSNSELIFYLLRIWPIIFFERINRFSKCARRVMEYSIVFAKAFRHKRIEPEHLLLGLSLQPEYLCGHVLMKFGIYPNSCLAIVKKITVFSECF